MTWLPADAGPTRLAFAIDRQVGNAVVRNRLRRRLRASFRALAPTVPFGTYLLRPAPAAATIDTPALATHLRAAIETAVRRP